MEKHHTTTITEITDQLDYGMIYVKTELSENTAKPRRKILDLSYLKARVIRPVSLKRETS